MYLSSVSSRLLLHDFNNGALKKSYGCYDGLMRDISWSDDGKYLLQVNPKGVVEILSTADHEVRCLQHVPLRETWTAVFHRKGHKNVAIGTRSGNVQIWDTKAKNITKTFPSPTHHVPVRILSYNADNSKVAANMQNADTIIYSVMSNTPVLTFKLKCSRSISAMKFHHESRALLGLATDDGHLVMRDISTNKDKAFFEKIHASPVTDFAYSLINKDIFLSCGYDKVMHVYDIRLQSVVSTIRTPYILTCMAINSDNIVALGTKTGPVLIYDLRDLTNAKHVLKDHVEEVKKVAFQPVKKKFVPVDISLREDADPITPHKSKSPDITDTSDIFKVTDSPEKYNNITPNNDDSFFTLLGLNKSGNETGNNSFEFDRQSNKHEQRYKPLDAEKYSTPLNNKSEASFSDKPEKGCKKIDVQKHSTPMDNKSTPPSLISPIAEFCDVSPVLTQQMINLQCPSNLKDNPNEELKDFIKLTIGDVADDSRNYFLHLMMVLTKQKLFMEKQMKAYNDQMQTLIENQNSLIESNRLLSLEIQRLMSEAAMK